MGALGGMRNPHISIKRVPDAALPGQKVKLLFQKAQELWPELRATATAILEQKEPLPFKEEVIALLRKTVLTLLGAESAPKGEDSTSIHSHLIRGDCGMGISVKRPGCVHPRRVAR